MKSDFESKLSACLQLVEALAAQSVVYGETLLKGLLLLKWQGALTEELQQKATPQAVWKALRAVSFGGEPLGSGALTLDAGSELVLRAVVSHSVRWLAPVDFPEEVTELSALAAMYDRMAARLKRRTSAASSALPPEVARLMARLLAPQPTERVYDPACGLGETLLAVAREAEGAVALCGQEYDRLTAELCRINLAFHGCTAAELRVANTLQAADAPVPVAEMCLCEPPFGSFKQEKERTITRMEETFVRHMLQRMHPTAGRLAVLVPYNFLYNTGATLVALRKALLERNLPELILRLPPNVLFGTSVQTFLLVLKAGRRSAETCFINLADEAYYTRVGGRNVLTAEAVEAVTAVYRKEREPAADFGWWDTLDAARCGEMCSFDDVRFHTVAAPCAAKSVVELQAQIAEVEAALQEVRDALEDFPEFRATTAGRNVL